MITLNNVTKKYGDTVVLENIKYSFPNKGIVCVMGPSGGGKTTLLNLIAGFDSDYTGDISVGDEILNKMNDNQLCDYRRKQVGFVFQNYHLLLGYSVLENVMLPLELVKISKEKGNKEAVNILEQLGMSDKINQKASDLSGGQKQRAAIARALIGNKNVLLCDEPTGALDRKTSNDIMEILQKISKDKLVIVITHDEKLLQFADEVLRIQDKKLVICKQKQDDNVPSNNKSTDNSSNVNRKNNKTVSFKNFKVHLKRYLAVALAISIGITSFVFSLSFGNIVEQSIADFEEKNTVLHNGYIKGSDEKNILNFLQKDERIENIYYQYKLGNIKLELDNHMEVMEEKLPMPMATQTVSYGIMPRHGENEISITPSLAKKFANDISSLIGKNIKITYKEKEYVLKVSGIYNAGYDDFMISSDVEQDLYKDINGENNYSISYDVKEFENIVLVSEDLKLNEIDAQNASKEVGAMLETFESLQRLFFIVSVLVLLISIFLCVLLIVKQQNTRYREVGLLAALGFKQSEISAILRNENFLFSVLAGIINFLLVVGTIIVCKCFGFSFSISAWQAIGCIVLAFASILIIGEIASIKLIRTEPAKALRK